MNEVLLEIIEIIHKYKGEELRLKLEDYHDYDIAKAIPEISQEDRNKLYKTLDDTALANILSYLDDVSYFFDFVNEEKAADIIEHMDADDAVDILEELEEEDKEKVISLMDEEAVEDIKMITSYEDDQIGSKMTTNFHVAKITDSVSTIMKKLITNAPENDNISVIFVEDENNKYCGSILLKDLIIARKNQSANDIVMTSYPSILDTTYVDDCIQELQDYSLEMIPVLNEKEEIIGALTSNDITEAMHEEFSEDFAQFAGMTTNEDDLNEKTTVSMRKRLPWLILLMFLGLGVSSLISGFDNVISCLPVIVFFQSLILAMAGNSGTQSLAVTISALNNQEKGFGLKMIFKEMKVGFLNGLVLGAISSVVVFAFLYFTKQAILSDVFVMEEALKVSLIVGAALVLSITVASIVGTFMPMFFKKINIDPTVASGPLITTVNDVIAVVVYYGLTAILFQLI